MLRFACKTFSKPSAYNQVLFHKTCKRVNFDLRVFFTRFANSQVFAIFGQNFALTHCFLLCFAQVSRRWLYEKCAKCKRHLWTGCTSSCHPELDSGSINAKKFQNFFIVFAKKCNFFSIIKMYKKNYF